MTASEFLPLDWLPLDRESIPQGVLDIEAKTRANPLPWKGQFSPQLIHVLLTTFATRRAHVLDPFVGSGTVFFEAARCNLAATGAEINPAAIALSRLYLQCNCGRREREVTLSEAARILTAQLSPCTALESSGDREPLTQLKGIRSAVVEHENAAVKDVLYATLVLADFGGPGFDQQRMFNAWEQVRQLVQQLPYSEHAIRLLQCDARHLPLPAEHIDLVVTSPPYINVFNYHQQYRPSVEEFGWDVLSVAQSEIGSNRKHRSNRFLTVIQYCLDLAEVFAELARVTKPGARIIFIVGRESSVRGKSIRNGELLLNLATRSCGLRALMRQERKFTNRFGQLIYEDILHFEVPSGIEQSSNTAPRDIATEVLSRLLDGFGPSEVREDIEQAVLDVDSVRPSRRYSTPSVQGLPTNCSAQVTHDSLSHPAP